MVSPVLMCRLWDWIWVNVTNPRNLNFTWRWRSICRRPGSFSCHSQIMTTSLQFPDNAGQDQPLWFCAQFWPIVAFFVAMCPFVAFQRLHRWIELIAAEQVIIAQVLFQQRVCFKCQLALGTSEIKIVFIFRSSNGRGLRNSELLSNCTNCIK